MTGNRKTKNSRKFADIIKHIDMLVEDGDEEDARMTIFRFKYDGKSK